MNVLEVRIMRDNNATITKNRKAFFDSFKLFM